MVSIVIMFVIITMVLSNQSTYTRGASLKNLANDIGLSIRQAQIYGISVKALPGNPLDFSTAYGIDFNIAQGGGSKTAYIFFADRVPADYYYNYTGNWLDCPADNGSNPSICIKKVDIVGNNSIEKLCQINNDNSLDCTIVRASISFLRPDTSAFIKLFNSSGSLVSSANYKGVEIDLISSNATDRRSVKVYNTGQISIQ